ncbi:MAG TPA: dihydroorotate dehydrogenase (quinone) [Candidatus Binatia bacterium]|nr:dihydroorotate dehydrogenase (quinone) [Candidatus Binatia bacterium]
MELRPTIETFSSEHLKTAAEITLAGLSKHPWGERVIERYAFWPEERVESPALHTEISGIELENPVMVGAGWDKKGRAVWGLYHLGFSGVEVGTVPLFAQPGNPRPRMWTFGNRHSVGLNRLGFNSNGVETSAQHLEEQQPFRYPVGINVGKNKLMTDDMSPQAHAEVVKHLYKFASYFVFNPSSPNTPGLTNLQRREPLSDHLEAMQAAMLACGGLKPLYSKISPDITPEGFEDVIEVSIEKGASGLILCNTTASNAIKAKYGKHNEMGGLSGDDWEYRAIVQRMVRHAYEEAGDKLDIISAGAISRTEHAIERMMVGASAVQVVTGIRQTYGRVAADINKGILDWMKRHDVASIKDIIGVATKKGPKSWPKQVNK